MELVIINYLIINYFFTVSQDSQIPLNFDRVRKDICDKLWICFFTKKGIFLPKLEILFHMVVLIYYSINYSNSKSYAHYIYIDWTNLSQWQNSQSQNN